MPESCSNQESHIKISFLSNQQSKTEKYSGNNQLRQRKDANSHMIEAGNSVLCFCLKKKNDLYF